MDNGTLVEHQAGESHVMVVDDDPAILKLLSHTLWKARYTVTTAEGGEEALAQVRQRSFDLVLLDLRLPDADGIDILKKIRADHAASDMPVIVVTGNRSRPAILDSLAAGANDYVIKPFDVPVVLARIQAQLVCKKAFQELREAQTRRLEIDGLKNEFLAMIGHELNNPISSALGALDLIEGTIRQTGAAGPAYAAIIRRNLERILRLSSDVFDLSRMDSGRFDIRPAWTDLREVVRSACHAQSTLAQHHGIHLEWAATDGWDADRPSDSNGSGFWAMVDRDRLEQAVVNLIHNAVRFAARRVQIILIGGRDGCQIQVLDDGPGIDPADLPHIFDKFYRGRQKPGGPIKGAGLGLSIVRGIIEAHGGTVTAETLFGDTDIPRGARFVVTLPVFSPAGISEREIPS
ncbi:hybrid sensor histidine kinase/response regulator [bacterium]|nr:hybrid sensor histidine kinase/response regulator [bacterium]